MPRLYPILFSRAVGIIADVTEGSALGISFPGIREVSHMSYRIALVCAVIVAMAGCNKQEAVNSVQHVSAWQRQAGQSALAAATIAKQTDQNTADLKKAMQAGSADALAPMTGKLVALQGEVSDQTNSSWTIKSPDGWTIVAQVSDLTPHSNMTKDQIASCAAQGIIQRIDAQDKRIVMADVELAPEALSPQAGTMVAK
ncbi:MAG TPA: hypothetical protein VHS31_11150 [Tepidisphaeraceae bacterium]|nr:hypothetical protein [Tepidisphaeraceae bacterium]